MKIKRITAVILFAVMCIFMFSSGASAVEADKKNQLVEYFPKPIGKTPTFPANFLTGNFRFAG